MLKVLILVSILISYQTFATVVHVSEEAEDNLIADGKAFFVANDEKGVLDGFVSEMKRIHAPVPYMLEAMANLRGVIFKQLPEDTYGAYNSMTKTIYLPLEMRDPATGGLIDPKKMSEMKIGAIYHEMWHAYLDTVAKPRNNAIYKRWLAESRSLYSDHGNNYHDEAYGIFLDQVMINYIQLRRIFERESPATRERLRNGAGMKKIYDDSFNEKVNGYYLNPWTRQFIYTSVNLPAAPRKLIVTELLLSRPPLDYGQAFLESHF